MMNRIKDMDGRDKPGHDEGEASNIIEGWYDYKTFQRILDYPESGAPRPEFGRGVRIVPVENYLIIYRVDERGPLVLRVVHGAMDLTQIHIP